MTLPFASTDSRLALQARTLWGPLYELKAPPAPARILGDRFLHLDMTEYRTTMPAAGYAFFITFAGADFMGFSEQDLDELDSRDDL